MNTQDSSDLGEVMFRGPKPAPPIASWIAIVILLLGSVCVTYWTMLLIQNAQNWRANIPSLDVLDGHSVCHDHNRCRLDDLSQ